jgi:hypothetical protein
MGFSLGRLLTAFSGLSKGAGFSTGTGLSFDGFAPAPPGPTGNGLLWGAGNYLLWGASYLVWGATSTPEGTMLWDDGSHMLLWSGGNYSMVKTADDADTSVSSFLLMGA